MSTKTRKANPLPPIAPCPCEKPKCCGHVVNAVYGLWRVVADCGFAGPVCHAPRDAILSWNRRSDAEAERRGAMAVLTELETHAKEMVEASRHDKDAKWDEAAGYFATWATLRLKNAKEAIERGEVLPAKPDPCIVSTPGVMAGKPRVRGTRITVETLQSAAHEWTSQQILEQYPGLTAEGLAAALAYEMPKTKARKR